MPLILPVSDSADYSFTVSLSETLYDFKIRWVSRTQSWYISINENDGFQIIGYEKITPYQNIVVFNTNLIPFGRLYVIPESTNPSEELNRDNFGVGKLYNLVYFTNDELEEVLEQPIFNGWFLV